MKIYLDATCGCRFWSHLCKFPQQIKNEMKRFFLSLLASAPQRCKPSLPFSLSPSLSSEGVNDSRCVCFMKINELLSGLWGAGGRQAELRAQSTPRHATHTRSSPISRWLECLPAHCLPIFSSSPPSLLPVCPCGSPKNVVYTTRLGNFLQLRPQLVVCSLL